MLELFSVVLLKRTRGSISDKIRLNSIEFYLILRQKALNALQLTAKFIGSCRAVGNDAFSGPSAIFVSRGPFVSDSSSSVSCSMDVNQ